MVGGSYVVLLDDVAAARPAEIECRIQTKRSVEVDGGARRALLRGRRTAVHVVFASPEEAEVASGRAAIDFVSVRPKEASGRAPIVTVLYPVGEGERAPKAEFRASGSRGVLTVTRPAGKKDTITFARAGGRWRLLKVNAESTARIAPPRRRVVKPLR
jgi:hypothetical protein